MINLIIYVHEFQLETGHSRAMIELLNALPVEVKDQIAQIEVVSYEATALDKILTGF
jgi:hypothetical protein